MDSCSNTEGRSWSPRQIWNHQNCGLPDRPVFCPANGTGILEQNYAVAMAYVPWQQWTNTYPLEQALNQGTIFPELDLQFMYGGCRR